MREPEERARRVLAAAGVDPGRPAAVRPLGGGTCNTVEEPRLTDGTRCVLKTAPAAAGPRHQTRLLHSDAVFSAGRLRLGLYRAYLYLIMLVETVPRAADEGHSRWAQDTAAPGLVAALGGSKAAYT
ncbi:hypothetical protein [Streptomyces sp. NPDC008240]|uniref:hypothetical protein n=1 Tax=Streptomyces sp. NPDC008240 TaxID=3364822 RepID=UPI0036E6F617